MKTTNVAGATVEQECSVCDQPQAHTVVKVTKQGVVTEAVCEACRTVSKYTRGVKSSVSVGSGKNAAPYDRARQYKKGQTMTHEKFGHGEVLSAAHQKIDVLFGEEIRRLIHDQG